MPIVVAQWFADLITAYLIAGGFFVLAIQPRWLVRLDDGLRGAPWTVRLLIAPGLALLWPLFLARLATGAHPPTERNAHRRAAGAGGRREQP